MVVARMFARGVLAVAIATLAGCSGAAATGPGAGSVPSPAAHATHGLTVLFPPITPGAAWYADVQAYLVNSPVAPVAGANLAVSWSAIDHGPGASPQYDWSSIDDAVRLWTAAGKKACLTVWGAGYGTGPQTLVPTPTYVQQQVPIINCNGSAPAYWQPGYYRNYQAFMAAAVERYGSNPAAIGYIRFGLGIGGETTVVNGFNAGSCQAQLSAAGYTTDVWLAYLGEMLDFERSLHSTVQLMVSVNVPNNAVPDYSIPNAIAARAVSDGLGLGNQGLQLSDLTQWAAGRPCSADWCALFDRYSGLVPLELQTLDVSDP
jgi:hypothetical protein